MLRRASWSAFAWRTAGCRQGRCRGALRAQTPAMRSIRELLRARWCSCPDVAQGRPTCAGCSIRRRLHTPGLQVQQAVLSQRMVRLSAACAAPLQEQQAAMDKVLNVREEFYGALEAGKVGGGGGG